MLLQIRIVVTLAGQVVTRRKCNSVWGTENVLFIDLGACYMVYLVCRLYSEMNT